MSNVSKLDRAPIILQNFFNNCIGTGDERALMDVVITDSFIKEVQEDSKGRAQVVDYLPAYDINFVFNTQKYRTFRVAAKFWDKALKTMKRMAETPVDLFVLDKGEENPMEQLLKSAIRGRYYRQAVVMQDLGVDFPVSVLFNNPVWEESLSGITDGDLAAIELRHGKLGSMLSEALKKVKANLNTIANDNTIIRDHNLYFSNFIDFNKRQLGVSLTRLGYKLTGDINDTQITPHKLEVANWSEIFTSEQAQQCLNRLNNVFANFNQYSMEYFQTEENEHPLRTYAVNHLFSRMWGQIMSMSEPVYFMDAEAMKHELESVAEEVLKEVLNSGVNPGLDLNSWKVWDYANPAEPKMVLDIGATMFTKYRNEFMDLLYSRLLTSGHTLIKPYGVKTVITDPAEIAARPIGDVRTETF